MKLAIIGSRSISDLNIDNYITEFPDTIITGGAKGVDTLAESFANSHNIPLEIFKPDYKRHLRGAPIRRNETIARECDALLAFWDGKSRGTKYTFEFARKLGKSVHVVTL